MKNLIINIRQEQPSDYDEVYELVRESFLTENHTEEPDYLNALRKQPEFISELSLVAETEDRTIVGQIVISKTVIEYDNSRDTQLVVSPLSVSPKHFRRGIGSALLREGLKIAKRMGYKAVFLWGNPEFYSKNDFVPSYRFNIYHKDFQDKNVDFIMVYELTKDNFSGEKGIINIY